MLNGAVLDHERHVYAIDGVRVPSVTDVLRVAGYADSTYYLGDEARWRGRAVHAALQYLEKGTLDWSSVDDQVAGRLRAYLKFKSDMKYVPMQTECVVSDPVRRYAGCLDTYGHMDGKPAIIDFKTGAVPSWAGLQLSGYRKCVVDPDHCADRYWPRYGLELRPDETYRLIPFRDVSEDALFLAAVSAFWWKLNRGYKVWKQVDAIQDQKISLT